MAGILPKNVWKEANGAAKKAKRLRWIPDDNGMFICPVSTCDHHAYHTERGCRKHITQKHGWYFYFDEKPNIKEVLPKISLCKNRVNKRKRQSTKDMPMFSKTCSLYLAFKNWLLTPGGGGKSNIQADQVGCRVLKYLKFCCKDEDATWDIPNQIADYCLGTVSLLSDFVSFLRDDWNIGYSGVIGYMNSISHLLDFRRANQLADVNVSLFMAAEIYVDRVKRCLAKQMRAEWNTILSIEYLTKIDCWATLEDLNRVIPFHANKFAQIMINRSESFEIPAHDLTFCTSFITTVFFLLVKASRPMTFQNLTVSMISNVDANGYIDQTAFKTKERYGFDSLIFSKEVLDIVNGYIQSIRPLFNPQCDYVLVTRNGTKHFQLSHIFGKMVFLAIGKYIHPTRYRQIIETESAENLTDEQQRSVSEDQKHTSLVAKVHYQKIQSRTVALKAQEALKNLRDNTASNEAIKSINKQIVTEKELSSKNSIIVAKRKKKVPFTEMEDNFIREGIKKHGCSRWKAILSDPNFKFDPSRTTATILTRAKTKGFI